MFFFFAFFCFLFFFFRFFRFFLIFSFFFCLFFDLFHFSHFLFFLFFFFCLRFLSFLLREKWAASRSLRSVATPKFSILWSSSFDPKGRIKATFYCPTEAWAMPAPSLRRPEDREFVVDSRASVRMLSKMNLSSAELGTMRKSRNHQRWLQPMEKCK